MLALVAAAAAMTSAARLEARAIPQRLHTHPGLLPRDARILKHFPGMVRASPRDSRWLVSYGEAMIANVRKALSILDRDTRRAIPLLLGASAGLAVLDAVSIGLVFPIMLAFVSNGESSSATAWLRMLPAPSGWHPALFYGCVAVALLLSKNIGSAALVRWQHDAMSRAEADVGLRLYASYLQRPWREIGQRNSAEMMRTASVSASHAFLSFLIPLMNLAVELMLAVAVLAVVVIVDVRVALSAMTLLAVAGIVYYLSVRQTLSKVGRDFQEANFNLLKHLKQGIGAGREIRVLGRSEQFLNELRVARRIYADAQAKRAFYMQLPRYYLESILVLAAIVGILVALPQRSPDEVGAVMALFGVAALRLMTSANRILGALQQVRTGTEPLRLVHEDLQRASVAPVPFTPAPPTNEMERGVAFDHVHFAYTEDRPALSDIRFQLPWGSSLGIVGPSGSGKSTLIDVLLGLLPPDRGAVLCDGRSIWADLPGWRRRIGFVPQNIYLTDDTLRRNVAFGVPPADIDDDRVKAALALAQLDAFVASLPDGLDTMLGDMGSRLSGGQRQRVGIARALYHDPDVLVFDEATSALDGETEAAVVEAIEALAARKTLIVVAHRLSTVRRCECILVLEEGRITAQGRFDDLMANNATLQRMTRSHAGP